MAMAMGVLVWPGRTPLRCRLLAFAAVSFVILLSLTLPWNPWGARFLLTAMALGAPLTGLIVQRPGPALQVLALVLAVWGGATGIYAAWLNDNKPMPQIANRNRLDHLIATGDRNRQAFYREIDQELAPEATVAVSSGFDEWDYPFFGSRFRRTLVPLVEANYVERFGLIRPLRWTNESLWARYDPSFLVVFGETGGAQKHPDLVPGRCFQLPLQHGKPAVRWELWRCDDRDPRNLIQNGDFSAWSPNGSAETPDHWEIVALPGAQLHATRLNLPTAEGQEPFRAGLRYRGAGAGAGIGQLVAVDDALRGSIVVVDARLQASRVGAALLRVDDGESTTAFANRSTGPETIRLWHRVDPEATDLEIVLVTSEAGQDADVTLRSILAVPRPAS
jgi:hypothetical protein